MRLYMLQGITFSRRSKNILPFSLLHIVILHQVVIIFRHNLFHWTFHIFNSISKHFAVYNFLRLSDKHDVKILLVFIFPVSLSVSITWLSSLSPHSSGEFLRTPGPSSTCGPRPLRGLWAHLPTGRDISRTRGKPRGSTVHTVAPEGALLQGNTQCQNCLCHGASVSAPSRPCNPYSPSWDHPLKPQRGIVPWLVG